jgi:Uma2 family endonuclease
MLKGNSMATAVLESKKHLALEPRQYLVLNDVDWATYRRISDALTDHHVRLTYNRGVLELMTLSTLHEVLSRFYNDLLVVLADEFDLPFASCGSMTCDREDLNRGVEPDESYYLVNAPAVRARKQIDLTIDPPPDLMVEVDLSSSSKRRLEIYAAIKVPEVWQVNGESLKVLQLGPDGKYAIATQSMYFPGISLAELAEFVQRREETDHIVLLREFRAWVRDCLARK